ncbi:hypothetical protein F5887DRAFT_1026931 [Amanita rubescens]|nr:hypothetical protein F5887DRAFT_1026931 [Amanita rubescens]
MDKIVWEDRGRKLGSENVEDKDEKWGMILPRVILRPSPAARSMLTASNVKKNDFGSELKAVVCAPPGYTIVGGALERICIRKILSTHHSQRDDVTMSIPEAKNTWKIYRLPQTATRVWIISTY